MNLPITSWRKTLRQLGFKVVRNIARQSKQRRKDNDFHRYEPLEPRQLMAGDTGLAVQAKLNQLLSSIENPIVTRLGQFDNDPTQDVAILSSDGRLTIAVNNGDNSIQSRPTIDLGIGAAHGLELTLVNDDAFTDLVIQGSDSLFIALNDGDGNFTVSQALTPANIDFQPSDTNSSLRFIADDLNGDFQFDVAALAPDFDQVVIYLGVGDGTFSAPIFHSTGGANPTSIASGNTVGNSLPDLAIGHADGSVTLLQNEGEGAFANRPEFSVQGLNSITDLATADLDADGDSDIVVASGDQITILENQASQTNTLPVLQNGSFNEGLRAWNVETFGQTADSNPGVVIAQSGFAQLVENESFLVSVNQDFIVPDNPETIEIDILALGLEDPAGGIPDAFEISILDASGNSLVPTFRPDATSFFNANPGGVNSMATGVTFDGRTVSVDISGITAGSAATIFFDLIGNGPGTGSTVTIDRVRVTPDNEFDSQLDATTLAGPFVQVNQVAVADVDGDGRQDIVATDNGSGQLLVFNGRGNGQYDREEIDWANLGTGLTSLDLAPLTAGDSVSDIAVLARDSRVLISPLSSDNVAPTVELVSPVANQTNTGIIERVELRFDEPVRDNGPLAIESVTNPNNYVVTFLGEDNALGTADDVSVNVVEVNYETSTGSVSLRVDPNFTPLLDGQYRVTLASDNISDLSGNRLNDGAPVSFEFSINASGPIIEPIEVLTGLEGQTVNLDTSFTDPGGTSPYTAEIGWGDGTVTAISSIELEGGVGLISASHTYADNGLFDVMLTIVDANGVVTQTFTTAEINNSAPVVEPTATEINVVQNQLIDQVIATFTDLGFDNLAIGTQETFLASIDWGDGTVTDGVIGRTPGEIGTPTSGTVARQHTFNEAGSFTVTVTVTDDDGGQHDATFTVEVENPAAVFGDLDVVTGDEGSPIRLQAEFNDVAVPTNYTAIIDWGDGQATPAVVSFADGIGLVTSDHVYPDNGNYTITIELAETGTNNLATATTSAIIGNVAPTLAAVDDLFVDQGVEFTVDIGNITDPGFDNLQLDTTESFTGRIAWGDGTSSDAIISISTGAAGVATTATVIASHTYQSSGEFTATLIVSDDDGGQAETTFNVTVTNRVPEIEPLETIVANEGESVSLSANFTDDSTTGTFAATIHWGDETTSTATVVYANGSGTISGNHVYADNGDYEILIELTEAGTDSITTTSGLATIANVAPSLDVVDDQTAIVGSLLTVDLGAFIDPGFTRLTAGTSETFEATVDWGDGASSVADLLVHPGSAGFATTGIFSASHTFSSEGMFTATLTLMDDDGGTSTTTFRVDVTAALNTEGVWLPAIDFDSDANGNVLQRGEVVAEQWAAWGVHITTHDPINHPALIFDSANPTGGDTDLATPNEDFGGPGIGSGGGIDSPFANELAQGNILIISEDADTSDPDDRADGGTLIFTFDNPVMLDELHLLDIDEGDAAFIRLFDADGVEVMRRDINGTTESNSFRVVDLSATNISRMEVEFTGSGAITDLVFCRDGHPGAVATIAGQDTVDAGAAYELTLENLGGDLASWTINWGDGVLETVSANATAVAHVFVAGTRSAQIVAFANGVDGSVYQTNSLAVDVQIESVKPANIDFSMAANQSALQSGDILTDQFAEFGIHVTTHDPTNHPAIIFDSSNPTGGDTDLGTPNVEFGGPGIGEGGQSGDGINDRALGNILIISEDADTSDPDDNVSGGTLLLTFDAPVQLDEIGLLDIDGREAYIRLYDIEGGLIVEQRVDGLGNNSHQNVALDAVDVSRLEVEFTGSGALTEIIFCRDGHDDPADAAEPAATKLVTVDGDSDRGFQYDAAGNLIEDFELVGNASVRGVTTTPTGNPVWVLRSNENVYVYDRQADTFLGQWDAVELRAGRGIASNGEDVWIVDSIADRVYFYDGGADWTNGSRTATSSFSLLSNNNDPSGLAVFGDRLWVSDASSDKVFVYNVDGTHWGNFSLDDANGRSSGITTDVTGQHLWVTDYDDGVIYYYENGTSVSGGSLSATSIIPLAANNQRPEGIADPAESISLDEPVVGAIAAEGEMDEFVFSVDAGQSIFVDFQNITGGRLNIELIAPDGSSVFTANSGFGSTIAAGPFLLQQTGSYILVAQGNNGATPSYEFTVHQAFVETETIAFGEAVSGSIQTAGSTDHWELAVTQGQVGFFDFTSLTDGILDIRIVAPDGSVLLSRGSSAARSLDHGPVLFDQTGIYTLTAAGRGTTTPQYEFTVHDVTAPQTTPLEFNIPTTVSVDTPGGAHVLELDSQGDEQILLTFSDLTVSFDVTVQSPSGQSLFSQFRAFNFDTGLLDASEPGTYTVTIDPRGDSLTTVTVEAFSVPTPVTETISLGDVVSGMIEVPFATNIFEFDAVGGQETLLDFQSVDDQLRWTVFAPDGSQVDRSLFSSRLIDLNRNKFTLEQTGTYQILIEGNGSGTPAYQFELLDIPAPDVRPLVLGERTTGSIDFPASNDIFEFSGTTGQNLYLDVTNISGRVGFRLRAPDGTVVESTLTDFVVNNLDRLSIPLPQTGVYQLEIQGDRLGTPSYEFILDEVPPPDVRPIELNEIYLGAIEVLPSVDQWTFDGNAGQQVFIDFQRTDDTLAYELLGPDGTVVTSAFNRIPRLLDRGLVELPADGQYTLQVRGTQSRTPDSYQFRITDIVAEAPIEIGFNTPITGVIDLPGETRAYVFEGVAGEAFTFDALQSDSGIGFTLIDPSGSQIFANQTQDQTITSLPQTGVYQLIVDNANSSDADLTGQFAFQLIGSETAPDAPVAANLVVSNVVADRVVVGDPATINISWTVTNQGTEPAIASADNPIIDRVIFSAVETFGTFDERIFANVQRTETLAPGASYDGSVSITLPPGTEGSFFTYVVSDATNVVFEGLDIADNVARSDSFSAVYAEQRPTSDGPPITVVPSDGSRYQSGTELTLAGNVGSSNESINAIFVLDISTSTTVVTGLDANGDGVVNQADDFNDLGASGDILDVEIAAALRLTEQLQTVTDDLRVSTVVFAGGTEPVDSGPELFDQHFVDPSIAPDSGQEASNFETAITSLFSEILGPLTDRQGVDEFRSFNIAAGTEFNPVLEDVGQLLATAPDADRTLVYFLTDGAGLDTDPINVEGVADQGVEFFAFQIGQPGVTPLLAEVASAIDSDPSSTGIAISIDNPEELTEGLLSTINVETVTVKGTPVAALDPAGNFFTPVTIGQGANSFLVEATTTAGTTTQTEITLFGDDLSTVTDTESLEPAGAGLEAQFSGTTFNRATNQLLFQLAVDNQTDRTFTLTVRRSTQIYDQTMAR